MRLYYFTGRDSLVALARHGIAKKDLIQIKENGHSPEIRVRHKGVWLTSDPNPILYAPRAGRSKDHEVAFAYAVKEQAIRFTVEVEDDDPKLAHWFEWGRKSLDRELYRRVDEISRRDRHTRWIYLDSLGRSQLSEPYDFEARAPLPGWPLDFGSDLETDGTSFDAMDLDDAGWTCLQGADRRPYDPRDALRAVERGEATEPVWEELWGKLYHRGEVGEASYAAVPHLVRIHATRRVPDWNTYALSAAIELARQNEHNPDLPESFRDAYQTAWRRLIELGLGELETAGDPRLVSGVIAVVAIGKGQFELGHFALLTSDQRAKILGDANRR